MKKRPDVLEGKTHKVTSECGNFYLTLNTFQDQLAEVRFEIGKTGHCQKGLLHLIGVLISDRLQNAEDYKEMKKFIRKHFDEFSCGCPFIWRGNNYKSCIDYAGKKILGAIKEEEKEKKEGGEQS